MVSWLSIEGGRMLWKQFVTKEGENHFLPILAEYKYLELDTPACLPS